jgi:DtxR family Mn-dependent transcriptional regulator
MEDVMSPQYSRSVADYLKAIYDLTLQQEITSTLELADALSVAPSSITSMLKKLAKQEPALVEYHKSYGVSLTEEGRLAALGIIRRHRLIEEFLYRILGYEWEAVHPEADELEHVISARFEDHLAKLLGEPLFDPHGDPIPARDLTYPIDNNIPINALEENVQAVVRRVHSSQKDLLQHLAEHGIKPGTQIRVLSRNPIDNTVQLGVAGTEEKYAIGPEICKHIYVEVVE